MKRIANNINALLSVILALVVVQMVGFIVLRNPVRVNLSGHTYYDLSEKTLRLLDELDYEVEVTVFFQEEHDLYHDIDNLLDEYQYHSRNFHVTWVDPTRDLALTEQLVAKYGLTEAQVVVFDIGDKSKVVRLADIVDVRLEGRQQIPVYVAFKGEQAFSSAIMELMEGRVPKVYFLAGHGERRVTDFDPLTGYSRLGTALLRDNMEIQELMLSGDAEIPDDADALVVAGPDKMLSTAEVEIIEDYLNRSGRVMVLIDALKETGLEPMLRRWGIGLRQDIVVDPENTLRGSDVHVRRFSDHPISVKMESIVQMFLPRSVTPLMQESGSPDMADRPSVISLLFTSAESWSETQTDITSARFDENTGDKRGPFGLGVAVERGASEELLDVQIMPSRMVVFGDSDFVSNGSMVGGNPDLFMNSLNWLLDREELMAISAKPIEEVRISLTKKQLKGMAWLNVVGIPLIAVLIGMFVWIRRRK